MSSSTTIDNLPTEMICELFKHLTPKDLLVCSMVNKRWHSIYADFKVRRLVTTDDLLDYYLNWCDSNQAVQEEELCHRNLFNFLVDKPLLSNLNHFGSMLLFV